MLGSKGKVSGGEDLSASTGVEEKPVKSLFIAGDLVTKATGSPLGLKEGETKAGLKNM